MQPEEGTGSTAPVPPAAFLSDAFVGGAVKRALTPSGVLAVNVIADSPAGIARLKVTARPPPPLVLLIFIPCVSLLLFHGLR